MVFTLVVLEEAIESNLVEQKFKIGDRVVHKSRTGPVMAVKNYEPKDGEDVTCEWFDKSDMLQEKSFHQNTLDIYEDPIIIVGAHSRKNYY